ncbi:MAG TPA: alpha/beta hydrolase [Thermoanaerobaculia bacterium]
MRSLIVPILLLVATGAFAQYPPTPGNGTFRTIEALEYARVGSDPLLLDLRIPDGPGPHPVIVYLHSGAWISGDRTGGPAIRQARRGYAVASIEYRLAPRYTWPAQVEDAKAAVRWLRANAKMYDLDPARIGIFGASAGGHIAAVLGASNGVPALEGGYHGNAEQSSDVKVVVDLYGPTDLLKIEEQKLPCIPLDGNASWMPPSLLMGCPIQLCKEKTKTANPMTYVTPNDPPFLIVHGLLDCLVPFQQSVMLHQELLDHNVDSKLVLIPDGDHGGDMFNELQYQQQISDFLDEHLRGPIAAKPAKRRAAGR